MCSRAAGPLGCGTKSRGGWLVGADHTGMREICAQVTPVGLVPTDATVCPVAFSVAFSAALELCWLVCAHPVRAAITQPAVNVMTITDLRRGHHSRHRCRT